MRNSVGEAVFLMVPPPLLGQVVRQALIPGVSAFCEPLANLLPLPERMNVETCHEGDAHATLSPNSAVRALTRCV